MAKGDRTWVTFPLPTGGINRDKAPEAIADNECQWLEDVFPDNEGYAQPRGSLANPTGSFSDAARQNIGITEVTLSGALPRVGWLNSNLSNGNTNLQVINPLTGTYVSQDTVVWSGFSFGTASSSVASPGTFSGSANDQQPVGTVSWSNPSNAASSNDVRATVALNADASLYLKCTNFGFAIPAGATIRGIEVRIEKRQVDTVGTTQDIKDKRIKLYKPGSTFTVGESRANSGTSWPASDTVVVHGNVTDLWGETWTPADINSSSFGVGISVTPTVAPPDTAQAEIDHVSITVYYDAIQPIFHSGKLTDSKGRSSTAVGVAHQYGVSIPGRNLSTANVTDRKHLRLWRGASKVAHVADAQTAVQFTAGSTAVTGVSTSWSSNSEAGMYMWADDNDDTEYSLVGIIKSVNSNTSITLEEPALFSSADVSGADIYIGSIRPLFPRYTQGTITTSTSSTTVNGGNTRFVKQEWGTVLCRLFRKRDMAYIGRVSSAASDIQCTLAANAAVAMADEEYVAVPMVCGNVNPIQKDIGGWGFMTTAYGGRQFYANSTNFPNRLYWSEVGEPESVEPLLNYLDIPANFPGAATDITGLVATEDTLLIFKQGEVWGLLGTDPDTWSLKFLFEDGTPCGMSIAQHGNDVYWAGIRGIYGYSSGVFKDLAEEKLGPYYENGMIAYNVKDRMWGMAHKDYYFVHIPSFNETVREFTYATFGCHVHTGTFTTFTNLRFQGWTRQSPQATTVNPWFIAYTNTNGCRIFDLDKLFSVTDATTDVDICAGASPGPQPKIITKAYDLGNPSLMKQLKAVQLRQKTVQDIDVSFSVYVNDSTTTTDILTFPGTWTPLPLWETSRQDCFVDGRLFYFIVESVGATSNQPFGPWSVAYKTFRIGR